MPKKTRYIRKKIPIFKKKKRFARNLFDVKKDLIKKLGGKKLAELLNKSERALRSYNRYLIGRLELDRRRGDRIPSSQFLKNLKKIAVENKIKIYRITPIKEGENLFDILGNATKEKMLNSEKKKNFVHFEIRLEFKVYTDMGDAENFFYTIYVDDFNDLEKKIFEVMEEMKKVYKYRLVVITDVVIKELLKP